MIYADIDNSDDSEDYKSCEQYLLWCVHPFIATDMFMDVGNQLIISLRPTDP